MDPLLLIKNQHYTRVFNLIPVVTASQQYSTNPLTSSKSKKSTMKRKFVKYSQLVNGPSNQGTFKTKLLFTPL